MLKKPNQEKYMYRGIVVSNNLVNLNLVTEVYRDYMTYSYNDKDLTIYKIVFLMVNNEESIWGFDSEVLRDMQYNRLVGVK